MTLLLTRTAVSRTLAAVCFGILAMDAQAQLMQPQLPGQASELGLTFGAGYTDNVFRVPVDELSSTYSAVGLVGDYSRQSERLVVTIASDVEYRDYRDNDLDSEPFGTFGAFVELFAVRDRFSWTFSDDFTQGRTDPFIADNPLNRRSINVFSTGPQLDLPLGGRNSLRLGAQRADSTFEATPELDARSTSVDLGMFRAIDGTTEVGIMLTTYETVYDVSAFESKVNAVFLMYQRQLATGQALLQLGTNEVDYGFTDESSPFLNLAWNRGFGVRTQLAVSAGRRFVDTAQSFQQSQIANLTTQSPFLTADIFEEFRAGLTYGLSFERSQFSISAFVFEDDYTFSNQFDNDREQAGLNYRRDVSPRLSLGLSVYSSDREFPELDLTDNDRGVGIWLQKEFGTRLSLEFRYDENSRDGQRVVPYDETAARLMFRYLLSEAT